MYSLLLKQSLHHWDDSLSMRLEREREREREIHPYYDEETLLGALRESHTHAQSTFIHSPVDEERESSGL